jgi:hypothetical protein
MHLADLLFNKYPNATGLQIEALPVDSTSQVGGTSAESAEGRGEINFQTAWATPLRTVVNAASAMPNMSSQTAAGTGTLQGARGTQAVSLDGKALTGEKDIFGATWDTSARALLATQRLNWSGGNGLLTGLLNGNYWSGGSFSTRARQWRPSPGAARAGPRHPGRPAPGPAVRGPAAPGPAEPGRAAPGPGTPGATR